jgi:hexokinase
VNKHLPNHEKRLPLAFTFSFPLTQKALDTGNLVRWTKNVDCPDAVGKDVAHLLREAISRRKDLNVDMVAILNDTTGTLVYGVYLDPDCTIGLALGTGSNACYIEKADKIEKWIDRDVSYDDIKEVVINMECGGFGDNGVIDFVKTNFDRDGDQDSLFPNSFT